MNFKSISAGLVFSLFIFSAAWAENLVISMESAPIRAKPDFFSKVEATVAYGTQVNILSKEGAWVKVKHGEATGWLHKSAFAKAGPILKDIGKGEKAVKETYKDEIVTAGKGFNKQSEKDSKEKNSKLKYEAVEEIEARKVSDEKIKEFKEKGGLESQVLGK